MVVKFSVRNASYSYNNEKKLFENINFDLHGGEILSILGPNGVGKTTFLKYIMGFLGNFNGIMMTDENEKPMSSIKEIWAGIGYVPQKNNSAFSFLVKEAILMGRNPKMGEFSMPSEKDTKIVQDIMDKMNLSHLQDKETSKLSGGELQLVFIARALASEPKLMLLDEPESNLDMRNRLIILNMIADITKNNNISCIINTHYPEHALLISDKTIMFTGDGKYIYGKAGEVITEENIRKVYGVNAKITTVNYNGRNFNSILPVEVC